MDILGSIGLGAITGLVGPIITGFTNFKMLKAKNAHEIELLNAESKNMLAEAEADVKKTQAKVQGAIEEAETEAFRESIKEGNKALFDKSYMQILMQRKLTAWIPAVIAFLFGLTDFLRGMARPAITYYLVGASTWITYIAYDILIKTDTESISSEWSADLFEKITLSVIYLTVSCVSWWFGDRRMGKFAEKHLNKRNM